MDNLYKNIAAIIIHPIGQSAVRKPCTKLIKTIIKGILYTVRAIIELTKTVKNAAKIPFNFNTKSDVKNTKIGKDATKALSQMLDSGL
ncbi:hypothetical protein CE91St25_18360 [Campylobacter ureolyticus]|nr:hypothetical protein CE91St25_18360 [Campylobacter ureolyticus]